MRRAVLQQRAIRLFLPVVLMLTTGGCNSCQGPPEPPAPVPQQGRLPRVAVPAPSPQAVEVPAPSCAVIGTASVEEGIAPLEVHFTGEGLCTDGAGEYTWDFGDGSALVHDTNPVHVYAKAGTYEAHVTLADPANNATDTDDVSITVTAQ
jgi:hypothetical protein